MATAIIDTDGPGGSPYTIMESGAILVPGREDRPIPAAGPARRYDTLQWLMFQMGYIGPMFAQANHFNNYIKGAT